MDFLTYFFRLLKRNRVYPLNKKEEEEQKKKKKCCPWLRRMLARNHKCAAKKRSKLQRMKRKMCIYQQKLGISLSTSSQLSSSEDDEDEEGEEKEGKKGEKNIEGKSPKFPSLSQIRTDPEFKPLLQKYVLGSTLGKGAYGEVRRAKRKADSIDVAVKISFLNDTDMLEEPNQKEELPAEVVLLKRVCASPACPSIIQMLDYVITPTYVIIVLQLLKSCMDLCQFLYKKKRVLGEEKVRLAFRQIVGAFLHCHTRGVLHNDIKLENILYQPGTGRIKLIDFGYGDILHDHDYTYPPGALQYQPPEWIVYSRYRAEPCTVWALGVVLFELLHGFLPFQEEHQIVLCELDCFSSISEALRNRPLGATDSASSYPSPIKRRRSQQGSSHSGESRLQNRTERSAEP